MADEVIGHYGEKEQAEALADEVIGHYGKKERAKETGATGRKGSADTSAIRDLPLNKSQRIQVALAARIAEAVGVDVVFYESQTAGTQYVGAQGVYADGKIYLDINAGNDFTGDLRTGILKTMSHELTHFIEDYSPELYGELKAYAIGLLSEKLGLKDVDALIASKQARSQKELSAEEAEGELVADACEMMLRESQAVRELVEQNRGLGERIAAWIQRFAARVREFFGDTDRTETKVLMEDMGKAQELWDQALWDASWTHRETGNKNTAQEGGEKYSVRPDIGTDLRNIKERNYNFNNELLVGTTSDFLVKELGFKPLSYYMSATKAYRSMVTEQQAVKDGQPTGENIHYHGLGVEGLRTILERAETPVAAFVSAESDLDSRATRLVLVTDYAVDGGYGVTVVEPELMASPGRGRIRANKSITVFSKEDAAATLNRAVRDDRILYVDKNRGSIFNSGGPRTNNLVAISEEALKDNIALFWGNVKWRDLKKSGATKYTSGIDVPNTPMAEALKNWVPHSDREYNRPSDTELLLQADASAVENPEQGKLLEEAKKLANRIGTLEKWINRKQAELQALPVEGPLENLQKTLIETFGIPKESRKYIRDTLANYGSYLANGGRLSQKELNWLANFLMEEGTGAKPIDAEEFAAIREHLKGYRIYVNEKDV